MPRKRARTEMLDSLFATVAIEAEKRRETDQWYEKGELLRGLLMPVQALLEADKSRRKAVRSPRQTGKSTGVMLVVSIRCFEEAHAEWVVIGVTRKSAKAIYWAPLKELNQKFELGLDFHNQDLEVTFPNGSTLTFMGADNISELEKIRGRRLNGVVVDESKSFPVLLFDELIYEVIEPALMAKNGELILIGTPGDSLRGTFYMATVDEPVYFMGPDGVTPDRQSNSLYGTTAKYPAKWTFHRWTLPDNVTQFPDGKGGFYTMWDRAQELMRQNGWTRKTPQAAREYFGDWMPADDKRVFRYRPVLHDYDPRPDPKSPHRHVRWGLPNLEGEFKTVLGVDPGTRDGTGVVVWAWNVHTDDLWELYSGKKKPLEGERLPIKALAEWYRELDAEYGPFEVGVSDTAGLATMVLDELADAYQVYLEPAEKAEKNDGIEVMNNDFDTGRIHLRRGSLLSDEIDRARWDLKALDKNKKVEDGTIPNDVSDAGLYAHRWCRHRRPVKAPTTIPVGSSEWLRKIEADRLEQRKAEMRRMHEHEVQTRVQAHVQILDDAFGIQFDREWWHDPK
jgi:hypothetical protein